MTNNSAWLSVIEGEVPLILSIPHSGVELPGELHSRLISPWLARKDTDWWVDRLYDFAEELGVTIVRTAMSRTVVDVNRDPSGASLYPGLPVTELCPTTTFDGEPLYLDGALPEEPEIAARRKRYYEPYHATLAAQIARLKRIHGCVVVYEAHSIRSTVPRLFDGQLAHFNIGCNAGRSCSPSLTAAVEAACATTRFSRVTDGRFKGGYTTRHYGRPQEGVHALQMELALRGYVAEPESITPETWPPRFDPLYANPMRTALMRILEACMRFANGRLPRP